MMLGSNRICQQNFNPFELNDIDSTQPNYEVDPDFWYFNDKTIVTEGMRVKVYSEFSIYQNFYISSLKWNLIFPHM